MIYKYPWLPTVTYSYIWLIIVTHCCLRLHMVDNDLNNFWKLKYNLVLYFNLDMEDLKLKIISCVLKMNEKQLILLNDIISGKFQKENFKISDKKVESGYTRTITTDGVLYENIDKTIKCLYVGSELIHYCELDFADEDFVKCLSWFSNGKLIGTPSQKLKSFNAFIHSIITY